MNLLLEIERFFLPPNDVRYLPPSQRPQRDQDISPDARLDHVLYQISLSEHLRTMQIMYRDSEDEQRLVLELREGDTNTALPTKDLMEKLLEGRCRVVALCRMCRGEDSVESLRALVDVASAYALQGQWAQVHEYMALATQKLVQLSASHEQHEIAMKRHRGSHAAACVDCCFRVLRQHAISNRGQITTSFLREVLVELSKLQNNRGNQGEEEDGGDDGGIGGGPNQANTRLTSELHTFFDRFLRGKRKPQEGFIINGAISGGQGSPTMDIAQKPAHKVVPSWGDVIVFLRHDCEVMREWFQDIDAAMLPQNKAALHLPFRMCDEQKRGIVHPAQYAATVGKFASTLKAIAGTTLLKQLQQVKMEVPLFVNQQTGLVIDITTGNKTKGSFESVPVEDRQRQEEIILLNGGMRIIYELPVAWEEILAKHVLEADCNPVEMLRSQVLTLLGVANVFSNKLDMAEDNLKNALKQLEKIGFEMEITACELYNSIAQLMITKHRRWDGAQKSRLRKQAFEWIMASDDGKIDVKRRVEAIKKHYESKSAHFVLGDVEVRAKNAAVKAKIKRLVVEEVDPTRKAVEAAYRYLVRAHEILETAHGAHHAAVATACLAVASVQNILGIYEESRDWLIKALRCMERLDPMPIRAIAFVQLQLAQVLSKQGYEDESLNVMSRAAEFHRIRAQEGLLRITEMTPFGPVISNPPKKGEQMFDDVNLAVDLSGRLVRAHGKLGRTQEAAILADSVAALVESAFDWDSLMTAEARRESGERFAAIGDWTNACIALRKSLEAFETLCGRGDRRTIEVAKLLSAALENRLRVNQIRIGEEEAAAAAITDGINTSNGEKLQT